MRFSRLLCAALIALSALPYAAQTVVKLPGGFAPSNAIGYGPTEGVFVPVTPATPLPTAAKQEVLPLANANVAAAAVTAYGGDYLLSQNYTTYASGSLAVHVLSADGVTCQTILTRSAADSAGATWMVLESSAIVRVTLPSGGTGCVANLSRVP